MISTTEKEKIIDKFKTHEKDTGSAEVQIALLSEEIDKLLAHLQTHKKDFHSKKGLLKMVAKRRKLLKYLEKTDEKKYKNMIKKLGLKS
ncbi:MAG TPA: 30S ribosomal protein S15 [Candidatus Pacearchaeota archaeon]|nr:30S ribosomal protein S15 [Candidatus Pacearchaeota archaeon]